MEPIEATFELNDTVYAKASIPSTEEVYLWLGVNYFVDIKILISAKRCFQANVMVSYPINEAEKLLDSKFSVAKQSLKNCEEDLDFLREQITVSNLQPHHRILSLHFWNRLS